MGKELQDHAAEFVRRVERGLGVAIREGQSRGDVLVKGEARNPRNQYASAVVNQVNNSKVSPFEYAKQSELSGNWSQGRAGIYDLVDGVSDAQFNEAIDEAKTEDNLPHAQSIRAARASHAFRYAASRAKSPSMTSCARSGAKSRMMPALLRATR